MCIRKQFSWGVIAICWHLSILGLFSGNIRPTKAFKKSQTKLKKRFYFSAAYIQLSFSLPVCEFLCGSVHF